MSRGTNASLTPNVNESFTLENPTNLTSGMWGVLTVKQPSSGGDVTISYGTDYRGPNGSKPALSSGNNSVDELYWYSPDGTHVDLFGELKFS